jgi:hypothetical protein
MLERDHYMNGRKERPFGQSGFCPDLVFIFSSCSCNAALIFSGGSSLRK